MAKIKSALEIALERTDSVKSDRGSIGLFEARQKGKKLANEFLEANIKSLEDEIKKESGDAQENVKQGIFDILISRLALPATKDDMKRIESASQGLNTVIGGRRFSELAKQLLQIMNQYLSEAAQYEQAIKKQYAPKLRQKEEELSQRLGRPVQLDPFQDPEFAAFYNQNMNSLKANYQGAVDEVREEAQRLFSGKTEEQ